MDPWGRLFHEGRTFLGGTAVCAAAPFFIFSPIFLKKTLYSHVWGQEFVLIQDCAFCFVILAQVVRNG